MRPCAVYIYTAVYMLCVCVILCSLTPSSCGCTRRVYAHVGKILNGECRECSALWRTSRRGERRDTKKLVKKERNRVERECVNGNPSGHCFMVALVRENTTLYYYIHLMRPTLTCTHEGTRTQDDELRTRWGIAEKTKMKHLHASTGNVPEPL